MTTANTPAAALPPTAERSFCTARAVFVFLTVLTLFRLVYSAYLGLVEDETYYWNWSRHLALSYYDQGPGIAYLIRLSRLLGGDTQWGVRIGAILCAFGTTWFGYLATRRWFGERIALWTVGLWNIAPLLAAGSLLTTYDSPQIFCWSLGLYLVTRTVQDNRPLLWYAVGLTVGIGMLCKLTMVLFAPGVLLFLLLSPTCRKHLLTPHPYLAFVIAVLLYAPVVLWNAQNQNLGFIHMSSLGNRHTNVAPLRWFGDFLAGQLLVVGPFVFLLELIAVWKLLGKNTTDAKRWAFAFTAPLLVLCLVVSLRSKLEINWNTPMHLTGLVAVAVWVAGMWQRGTAWGRALTAVSLGTSALVTLIVFYLAVGTLPANFHISADIAQKLTQTYGSDQIAAQVQKSREELQTEGKPVFVAGINYRVNSTLAYYLPDHPEIAGMYLGTRRDQYYLWTKPETLVGQNAILCMEYKNKEAIALAEQYFDSVTPLPPIQITRQGYEGNVKTWYTFACRNFHGYNPDAHATGY